MPKDFDNPPPPGFQGRWLPWCKAAVVIAIAQGRLSIPQTLSRYPNLSPEELQQWRQAFHTHGLKGLHATSRFPQKPPTPAQKTSQPFRFPRGG